MHQLPGLSGDLLNQISLFFSKEKSRISSIQIDNTLLIACRVVAKAQGIDLPQLSEKAQTLEEIAMRGKFRYRNVMLTDEWWLSDNGPLLGITKDTEKPCALLFKGGQYHVFDPETFKTKALTPDLRSNLLNSAFYFYRTFEDKPIHLINLFYFAMKGNGYAVLKIFILQFVIGLCSLLIPIATKNLFIDAIPSADYTLLNQWLYALAVVSFVIIGLSINQSLISISLRYKIDVSTQSALWDRILRLPCDFFRKFTSGDLATRINLVDNIQSTITTEILSNIFNGVFIILPLILMFYYNRLLGIIALISMLFFTICYYFGMRTIVKHQRILLNLRGVLNNLVIQLLNGINRIRSYHIEKPIFTIWTEQFTESLKHFYKSHVISIMLNVFEAVFFILITMMIFIFVIAQKNNISFGDFIGFNAAFGMFTFNMMSLANSLVKLTFVIPLYERARPVLQSYTEATEEGKESISLLGNVVIQNLSFKYEPEIPILDKINLTVKVSQFVAIVGPSGSGKSTLIRLLLGFEKPDQGHIFYDQQDLSSLQIHSLRKQLGVVLQSDILFPGTIYENICGTAMVSLEEAWNAADLVSLRAEITNMPMGMHTLVAEDGKTLSSGQKQRIIIARALVHKPRILILDEATSHLDNITQEIIHKNLSQQKISRIVIAQRLHSIMSADYIYVLDQGKIAQHGEFKTLLHQPGIFAEFARQQHLI